MITGNRLTLIDGGGIAIEKARARRPRPFRGTDDGRVLPSVGAAPR